MPELAAELAVSKLTTAGGAVAALFDNTPVPSFIGAEDAGEVLGSADPATSADTTCTVPSISGVTCEIGALPLTETTDSNSPMFLGTIWPTDLPVSIVLPPAEIGNVGSE